MFNRLSLKQGYRVYTFNHNHFRQYFPILADESQSLIYLDSAASTQLPLPVIETIEKYYRNGHGNVHRASHAFSRHSTRLFESARSKVAQWINSPDPESIIWTSGTTAGSNLIAHGLTGQIQPHQTIIVSAMEHHANLIPWQQLAYRTGAQLKIIPVLPSGDLDLQAFDQLLKEDTALVAISHVSNSLGTVNPVAQLCRKTRDAGAFSIIDGAQGVPHCAVDVQRFGCDAYLFSGHKVYGPTGIGVIYGKPEFLENLQPSQFGGEMVTHVSHHDARFAGIPQRLEAGTPNISGAIGLAAAIDFIEQWPFPQRQAHEQQLLLYAQHALEQIEGVKILGNPMMRAGLLSFVIEGIHPHDIATMLDQQGIAIRCGHHCAMPIIEQFTPQGSLRLSIGLYNCEADINTLTLGLQKLLELFRE